MELVVDESVDFGIIRILRERGYTVISVTENFSGIKDPKVLEIANEKGILLLTEDKDFGDLVYRFQLPHKGILLIRLNNITRLKRFKLVADLLDKYFDELKNNFSVFTHKGIRIRMVK